MVYADYGDVHNELFTKTETVSIWIGLNGMLTEYSIPT